MGFLEERRARVAAAFGLTDQVVVIGAGSLITMPGTDQYYPFLGHPEYRYLADGAAPDDVFVFDATRQDWTHFVPEITPADRLWTGAEQGAGIPRRELADRLQGRVVAMLGVRTKGLEEDVALSTRLRKVVDEQRRCKDAEEHDRIRKACDATRAGHEALRAALRPGVTEHELRAELEAGFFRAGAERTAYSSIVASGPNAAILHPAPSHRAAQDREMVLVDAAAEWQGYASDVTRTYAVGAERSRFQADIYRIVLEAQLNAIAECRPGREFKDIHMNACLHLAQGLVEMGFLRGKAESLVEQDAHALFFPHGLGHPIGLAVHDAGARLADRPRSTRFGLRNLRMDLPLAPGHVVTIEPGLYFVPAILTDDERRAAHEDTVIWGRVDQHLDFGGIRIEDDVLITETGPKVLTAGIPK